MDQGMAVITVHPAAVSPLGTGERGMCHSGSAQGGGEGNGADKQIGQLPALQLLDLRAAARFRAALARTQLVL